MKKEKFNVTGMTCAACSAHVEKAVSGLPGVSCAAVNLLGGSMQVEYDESTLSPEGIIAAVEKAGYGASLPQAAGAAPQAAPADTLEKELRGMKRRFVASLCFLLPLFYLAMGHMLGWPLPAWFHQPENALAVALIQFLLVVPIMVVNQKYYKVGFSTLLRGAPNMDSLIALGSAAAVVYGIAALFQLSVGLGRLAYGVGDAAVELERVARWSMDLYFESAGMILTLITLGKLLETPLQGEDGAGHRPAHGPDPQDRLRAAGRERDRAARGAGGGGRPAAGAPRPVHPRGRGGNRGVLRRGRVRPHRRVGAGGEGPRGPAHVGQPQPLGGLHHAGAKGGAGTPPWPR